jgi:hemolysin activation/secretion protein
MLRTRLAALLAALLAVSPAAAQETGSLESQVLVRGFRVSGNTVLPETEIRAALAPFVGRRLAAEDLIAARDALTRLYVDHGYTTSGVFLPDQQVRDGIVELRAEEGRLEDVHVRGAKHLRSATLRARLLREARGPLRPERLREALQALQEGPLLEQVSATLMPGTRPGLSQLELSVREAPQSLGTFGADNAQSPSVGSHGAELRMVHHNLLGLGDSLELASGMTRGLRSYETRYELPLGSRTTRVEWSYRASHADVVEDPFDALDIASRWRVVSAGVRHPLRVGDGLLWLGLRGELVRSRTFLDDRHFDFAQGAEDGETRVSALRASQEWLVRDLDDVWALRSTLSFGLDAFDASDAGGGAPDGTFFAWLGQAHWAHRFDGWLGGAQLSARADAQLSPDPLLSPERFALGGAHSVRGYRENQLVRDNALVGSIELRVPLLAALDGGDRLQLATFLDAGHAWDHRSAPGPRTLAAFGLGLRVRLGASGLGTLYWGIPLRHVSRSGDDWLQNHGLHLALTFWSPR